MATSYKVVYNKLIDLKNFNEVTLFLVQHEHQCRNFFAGATTTFTIEQVFTLFFLQISKNYYTYVSPD